LKYWSWPEEADESLTVSVGWLVECISGQSGFSHSQLHLPWKGCRQFFACLRVLNGTVEFFQPSV